MSGSQQRGGASASRNAQRWAAQVGKTERRAQGASELKAPSVSASTVEQPASPRGLSVALKQYRLKRSRELQVPAYTIFSDATLERIVSAAPHSREALLAIKGVGPRTWAQFGLEILQIIQAEDA